MNHTAGVPPSHWAMNEALTIAKQRIAALHTALSDEEREMFAQDQRLRSDMVESVTPDQVYDLLAETLRSAEEREALAGLANQRIAKIEAFRDRNLKIARGLNETALEMLELLGGRIEREDLLVWTQLGARGVRITDEAALLPQYRRTIPAKTEPDKIAIGRALREGIAVEGAVLENAKPHLVKR